MSLTNRTDKRVCFKVKTTAPKKYCVKPTTGILEANSTVYILVNLQPFDVNDPLETVKHKFQIQSAVVPEEFTNLDNVWKELAPEEIQDWKLKCFLDIPTQLKEIAEKKVSEQGTSAERLDATPPKIKNEADSGEPSPPIEQRLVEAERRAAEELKRLREEISRVTQENVKMREECSKLKRSAAIGESKADNFARIHTQPIAQPMTYTTLIFFVLIAVFFGYIIAKIY
ncbi:hypothetical protein QYM36_006362 [Artemia franciscana]|uniref:MSP domain-containing protein n=2 Tax=Artemia franciscana TaxID=6661 RepID=A0AA88I093_ARTSF|nr:hypothetical protein QYM36_006362 [Artemia franciscana]